MEAGNEIAVIPTTGEIVRLDDPAECADALEALRRMETQIREVKSLLSRAIAEQSAVSGTKTLRLGDGRVATVSGGEVKRIDAEVLANGLRAAGMPEDRIGEIVVATVSYTVKAVEAKRAAAANPAYADALDRATTVEDAPFRITIGVGRG